MARNKIETVPFLPNQDIHGRPDAGYSDFDQFLSGEAVPRGPSISVLQAKAMSTTEDERTQGHLACIENWADGPDSFGRDMFKDALYQKQVSAPGSSTFEFGKRKI
jgi:hypothetical protein